jgi:predicted RNase H-like HicB family nuclease
MIYPVCIELGRDHYAHCVVIPDLPGCFSAADEWQDLPRMIQEAIDLWFEGEDLEPPKPTPLATLAKNPDFSYGVWLSFDLDTAVLSLFYPVLIKQDAETQQFMVEFADMPCAYSVGDSYDEALLNAADALETAIMSLMDRGEAVPLPFELEGRPGIALSASMVEKLARYGVLRPNRRNFRMVSSNL